MRQGHGFALYTTLDATELVANEDGRVPEIESHVTQDYSLLNGWTRLGV